MKIVAKSLLTGIIAAGLFFSFLSILLVPTLALVARSHGAQQAPDVVVDAGPWLRQLGLPMSAFVFLATFGVALRQFTRERSQHPKQPFQSPANTSSYGR